MKLIFAGVDGASAAPENWLFNCTRNRACQPEFYMPIQSLADLILYLDFPFGQPDSISFTAVGCNGVEAPLTQLNYVIGQQPNENWYGVFTQWLEDISTLDTRFFIKAEVSKDAFLYLYYSNHFENSVCDNVTKLSSCYNDTESTSDALDCNNVYYGYPAPYTSVGNPNLRYYHNAFVRRANVLETKNKMQISLFNSRVAYRNYINKLYLLQFELVPAFYKDILLAIFNRGTISIGSDQYTLEDSQEIAINNDDERFWKMDIQLNSLCKQFFSCTETVCVPAQASCTDNFQTATLVDNGDGCFQIILSDGSLLEGDFIDWNLLIEDSEVQSGTTDSNTITFPCVSENVVAGLHGNLQFNAVNFSNSSFRAALASIPTKLMRFPGGENAQRYDWELGRDDSDTGQFNTLDQLKQLVDDTGCEVVYCLNICTKTKENQISMLQYAQSIGLPTNFVELGNEANNTGSLCHSVYPTADAYADEMAIWMAAIKAEFPDIKIGFCGENKGWSPTWNDKMIAKNPDALIWHEGIFAADFINESGNVDEQLVNDLIDAHFSAAGFNDVDLPIWCTEFNRKFDPDDPPLTEQQDHDAALFMLRKISSLLMNRTAEKQLMCIRGAGGNQAAVDDITFELTPIGLALQEFIAESSPLDIETNCYTLNWRKFCAATDNYSAYNQTTFGNCEGGGDVDTVFIVNIGTISIDDVTGIDGFSLAGSVGGGQVQTGIHGDFTAAIGVTISGTPVSGSLSLFKNGVLLECNNIGSAGSYSFSSFSFLSTDSIQVRWFGGAC